jgi:hypothetical protein
MKTLATILGLILLAAPVSNALAGAAGLQRSQARAHNAAAQLKKQQTEMWQKFDAEMSAIAKRWEPSSRDKDSKKNKAFAGQKGGKICPGGTC